MKKSLIIVVGLITGVFIFYLLGFRIVYAPWLENRWDAIGAVGTWVASIFSGIAIIIAIKIPKRIAEEQNKISLFEKRLYVFRVLESILEFFVWYTADESIIDFYPFIPKEICKSCGVNINEMDYSRIYNEFDNLIKQCESICYLFPIPLSEDFNNLLKGLHILYLNYS